MVANTRKVGEKAVSLTLTGRYAQLMKGEISVEDLDLEELARCQLKDRNGKFTGRPPKYIPAELVQRMRREFFKRGDAIFEDGYVEAVQIVLNIARNPKVDPAVRLKAATYVVERVRGKTPDKVIVEGDQAAWAAIATRIFVDAKSLENIVDAEVVDDDSDL